MCTVQKAEGICCFSGFSETQCSKRPFWSCSLTSSSYRYLQHYSFFGAARMEGKAISKKCTKHIQLSEGCLIPSRINPLSPGLTFRNVHVQYRLTGALGFLCNAHGHRNTAKNTSHQVAMMFSSLSWIKSVVTKI